MAPDDRQTHGGTARIPAIARYAFVCVAIGAVVAGLVVAALGGSEDTRATLPPVREIQLVKAVRTSGCELRRAGAGEQLKPAVDGPAASPARPRSYDDAPPVEHLTAALRRGVIVISYREDSVDGERLAQLHALQTVVPDGTIVTPDETGMRYEVAVAAYRRLLGCERFTDRAIDAIRLFRGRYLGTGPER